MHVSMTFVDDSMSPKLLSRTQAMSVWYISLLELPSTNISVLRVLERLRDLALTLEWKEL